MVSSVHLLEFETLHNYGREKDRIEVPVTLRSGKESVSFPAQLDTGATYCVFERTYAEILGLICRIRHASSFHHCHGQL